MDRAINPFTPNAGAPPPVLVGRDEFLEDYRILLRRLSNGFSEQSLLVTGLRGVGKTVLLNRFEQIAEEENWAAVSEEISPRFEFSSKMYYLARKALLSLSPKARWSARFHRAAGILKSFNLTFSPDGQISGALDVEAIEGSADSGFLDQDLAELLCALGEAAHEKNSGVVFLFDELQFLTDEELEGLVVALHKVVQRRLPVTLVGAGLPQLPALAGEARSYAERLFRFPQVERLTEAEAEAALTTPGREARLRFTEGALERIYSYTEGYPYFVQLYGRELWNLSETGDVLSTHVDQARSRVAQELDSSFFQVRTDRVSPQHKRIMRTMAEIGKDPVELGDLKAALELDELELKENLDELIKNALIFSPRFGRYSFTVPQYGGYLRRRYPDHTEIL